MNAIYHSTKHSLFIENGTQGITAVVEHNDGYVQITFSEGEESSFWVFDRQDLLNLRCIIITKALSLLPE